MSGEAKLKKKQFAGKGKSKNPELNDVSVSGFVRISVKATLKFPFLRFASSL